MLNGAANWVFAAASQEQATSSGNPASLGQPEAELTADADAKRASGIRRPSYSAKPVIRASALPSSPSSSPPPQVCLKHESHPCSKNYISWVNLIVSYCTRLLLCDSLCEAANHVSEKLCIDTNFQSLVFLPRYICYALLEPCGQIGSKCTSALLLTHQ